MNERELRVGNLLKYTNSPKLKPKKRNTLLNVIPDDIVWMSKNEDIHLIVEPVKLTLEFLKANGFREYMNKNMFIFSYVEIQFINFATEEQFYFNFFLGRVLQQKRIKYVHELQNLFFALVGEELPIKI